MKKLFLLLAFMGIVAVGCSKDEVDKGNDNKTEQPNENDGGNDNDIPENIFFGLDKESVTISPDGGSVDVVVYSNYKWEISGTSDWCTPSVKKGDANEDGQKVTFSADVAYDDREATFWFRCADEKIKFVVSQKSNNTIIYYTSSNGKVVEPYSSTAFGATILSNTYKDGVGIIEFNAPITTIGEKAFYGCTSLTSVTIPDSVATIGDYAFYECSSLTSVTIPDSVTAIGNWAFFYCSLTSVTIPDSVTTIGRYAFNKCSSLTSITIPDSVTSIGDSAFVNCSSLTSVYITDLSAWCRISFEDCFANPLYYAGNLYLNNELVTDLVIPSDVAEIKNYAFNKCSSLTSITIPDSVTSIGDSAFSQCRSQTSITIPDSVTTIGRYAFNGCSSLTSITIPDSVTKIGGFAFFGCSSLTSVYCKATTPPTIILSDDGFWYAFDCNASGRKIYVPTESVEAYKSALFWSDYYKSDIVGYDF